MGGGRKASRIDALPRGPTLRRPSQPYAFSRMHLLTKSAWLGSLLTLSALASEAEVAKQPWEISSQNIESGVMWQIGTLTSFPYRLIETQYSWKSAAVFSRELDDGSRVILRHRFTLIGALLQQGPESYYVAVSASPSIEWWNAAGTWSAYGGAGGGFGLVDSQNVPGALGQDFTLNWLIRGGVEHVISPHHRVTAGIMYQHMSNGGMTDPNPGIDALGFALGYTWSY